MVTAVEIRDHTPHFPALLDGTAGNFTMKEVSTDKACASVDNFACIDRHGAALVVAFKSHHAGSSGGLFRKAFYFFCFKKDRFFAH